MQPFAYFVLFIGVTMRLYSFKKLIITFTLFTSVFLLLNSTMFAATPKKERATGKKQKKKSTGPRHLISISIPKAGTHLLYKCVRLLDSENKFIHPNREGLHQNLINKVRALNKNPPPNHYRGPYHLPTSGKLPNAVARMKKWKKPRSFWLHWPYTAESEERFAHYGKSNFFIYRDPRDQLVSMAFMVHKSRDGKKMSIETLLLDLIDGKQRLYVPWAVEIQSAHPLMWELGVVKFYKLYLPWMQSPKFCVLKFEDLIGPNGGGAIEVQIAEIQKIAAHLGMKCSSEQALQVSRALFGQSWTFREGKIGSWKEHFTPEVKALFKATPGACQLLKDLGYEADDNW